jgi:hypothetical protein
MKLKSSSTGTSISVPFHRGLRPQVYGKKKSAREGYDHDNFGGQGRRSGTEVYSRNVLQFSFVCHLFRCKYNEVALCILLGPEAVEG